MSRSVRLSMIVSAFVALAASVQAGEEKKPAPGKGLDTAGKITLTIHKVQMTQGQPQQIEVEARGFAPRVTIPGAFVPFAIDFKNPTSYKATFTPSQTKEYSIVVLPDPFSMPLGDGPLEYTLKVKPLVLAQKPLLKVAGKLTAQDMKLQNKNTYYKTYPIKLKAGQTVVIDLQHAPNERLDPFLYLKDGEQTVAQDDDSGGDLNSRIVYTAAKDAEYTIVATTLFPATGDFTLTVRGTADSARK